MKRRSKLLVMSMALAVGLTATVPVVGTSVGHAGDDCATSRAANSLLGCAHCQAMKKLFSDDAISRMQVAVHPFDRGVLVEVHAGEPEDREFVQSFVDEMWLRKDHRARPLSQTCERRYSQLDNVRIERAPCEDGVFLILSSDDDEVVHWLQDDAQSTKAYVLAAATN